MHKFNFAMWKQALSTMPQVDKSQWHQLDSISKWLLSTRAAVLIMTFMAAALAGLIAWRDGVFDFPIWLLATLGLVLAHATNNLINDLVDSKKGVDKNNYYRNQYGVHVIEDKLMTMGAFWRMLVLTGAAAILFGLSLVYLRSGITLELMIAGVFFVLFYTWPLKYYGLGEPSVLLVWGPLMIGGTYYVTTGQWSWPVTWLSILFALGPTTVLFGKHTDKLLDDEKKGVKTLPVIIGESNARLSVIAMMITQYVLSIILVLLGIFHWALLIVLFNLPNLLQTVKVFKQVKPDQAPEDYEPGTWPLWFSAYAFVHNRQFAGLFILGVLADVLVTKLG